MNSELAMQASEQLAARLLSRVDLEAARVRRLYETAYGRPPTARELVRARSALARFEDDLRLFVDRVLPAFR